jgi:hypothetical protein
MRPAAELVIKALKPIKKLVKFTAFNLICTAMVIRLSVLVL